MITPCIEALLEEQKCFYTEFFFSYLIKCIKLKLELRGHVISVYIT